jgi:hypothetical protein
MPRYDPKWDLENDKDEWTHSHLICCILEGLRRAKIKPLNYSQVTLQRLKDALQKYTNIVQ